MKSKPMMYASISIAEWLAMKQQRDELLAIAIRARNESARVHPDFMAQIDAALAKTDQQRRLDIGERAVGVLAGLIKAGALDHLPDTRDTACKPVVAEWEATFEQAAA